MIIWVVITNANECCMYRYEKKSQQLSLLKEMHHPQSRAKGSELTTDRPGHYHSSTTARGAYESSMDVKDVEVDRFAQEIAKELDAGRKTNQFNHIILIAPPHMNGTIHQHLNAHILSCLLYNLKKDYTHLDEKEILEILHQTLLPH